MKIEREELLELIRRSREKDLDAQEELVRAVQDRVYYHCKKMLKNKEDAEDTTQTVLMTMIASLDKLKEPAAFWAWVNGITANQCKHLLTAPHKEWQIPEDEEGNSMLESVENLDETLVPEKVLDNGETRRMILGLVDEPPPEQRMSVLFYYYDEMSVKQIAEAMDTSEGTVKSRLNYARKSIKAGVEDYERKGVKLYGVSPLVLLVFFLRQEADGTLLDPATAAAVAGQVLSPAGSGAVSGGAAAGGAGAAAEGGASSAGGAASAAAKAGAAAGKAAAAAGTAVKAGISMKLIAGIVAGAIVVGGGAAGLSALTGQGNQPPAEEAAPPAAEEAAGSPAEPDSSFAQAHGFVIVEPQAFDDLPLDLVFGDPALAALPSTCGVTQPDITVSGPDAEGYVTYTVTYTITAQSRLGDRTGSAALSCSILAQDYNLYDYYTGRLYLPDNGETTASGEVRTTGSAVIQHDGTEVELTYGKNWSSGMYPGSWTESTQPDLVREIVIDSDMTSTIVARAPADYDGLLLGINVTDPADPDKELAADWNLETDDPSHYRFIRLSGQA